MTVRGQRYRHGQGGAHDQAVGIGDYQPYLSMALGAGDTTVTRMVNAYAALANHGRQREATLIDYVQDRNGKVIWRADNRACTGCNMPRWDGKPMPRLRPAGKQVLDPRTAYQVVHMLEGVVVRGTAKRCAIWACRCSARPARPAGRPTCGSWAVRPTSSPASTWAMTSRAAWAAMPGRAHRRADLQAVRAGHAPALGRHSVYRACRRLDGEDRSRSGQAGVRRHAAGQ
jgi:hypothetical protein